MKKLVFLLLIFFLLSFVPSVSADDCDSIPSTQDSIQKKIDCLSSKLAQVSSQANTLKNQINQFDAQIKLTTVKIEQVESEIDTLGGRIDQLKSSLDSLSAAFSSRAVETYKMSRFENGFIYLFEAKDLGKAVDRYHYLQKIQGADRDLIARLENAQTIYVGQKADQESLQKELQNQKNKLDSQKAAKNALLAATKGDESKYQALLVQAQAQLAAFRNFVTSQGGASILSNQTVKQGSWGYYYNQRDSAWGTMAIGSSDVSMADAGCLITSVAMVATHYGKSIKPSDIAANYAAFNPGTAYMKQVWSGSGVSVVRTPGSPSASRIDSEVNAGRPVIVGVYGSYSYPQHFIVIKSKEGDKYIMNDPFLENGGDRPLTDKYSLSNIVRVDYITVN